MLKIDYKIDGNIHRPRNLAVGDHVELTGDFPNYEDKIIFSSGERQYEVSVRPPFRYLGYGREKLVLSCSLEGLSDHISNVGRKVVAALGISHIGDSIQSCQIPGKLRGGLNAYLKARALDLPTYSWYLESTDNSLSLTPDLSIEGNVVTSTTGKIPEALRKQICSFRKQIEDQLFAIAVSAANSDTPLTVSADAYFVHFRDGHAPKVILGDLDRDSLTEKKNFNDAYDSSYQKIENFLSFLTELSF